MDVGFFEEENFAILLHNSLYFVISTNYHLFSSIFLEYIIDIKYWINAARGGGERLEGSSTVLEDAFRCSLIRIGGEEKEEGRVVARSRPARRGNNYSDVDRGRVTRALMLADGVCVCVCKSASCNGGREAKRERQITRLDCLTAITRSSWTIFMPVNGNNDKLAGGNVRTSDGQSKREDDSLDPPSIAEKIETRAEVF